MKTIKANHKAKKFMKKSFFDSITELGTLCYRSSIITCSRPYHWGGLISFLSTGGPVSIRDSHATAPKNSTDPNHEEPQEVKR